MHKENFGVGGESKNTNSQFPCQSTDNMQHRHSKGKIIYLYNLEKTRQIEEITLTVERNCSWEERLEGARAGYGTIFFIVVIILVVSAF